MQTDRRTFIRQLARQGSLAAGAAWWTAAARGTSADEKLPADAAGPPTATTRRPEPKNDPEVPIVDTHQHLWDLDVVHPPWLRPGDLLTRNFVMDDYLQATRGLNLAKAVYMEVAVKPSDQVAEAEYVLKLCRDKTNPTVAAVIGGQPGHDGFKEYISRFKDSPYIKGIRSRLPKTLGDELAAGKGPLLDDLRLLGRLGMRFDLCEAPQRLPECIRLVAALPENRFVLDHCGNADPQAFCPEGRRDRRPRHDPEQWRRDMARLARHENVICKISGIIARAREDVWQPEDLAPVVDHCLEVFGPDRVVFASDWPVCRRRATLGEWVGALQQIVADRPLKERQKLFGENATRFYGKKRGRESFLLRSVG
jgi:predicted TIM-barrel fold metal-dependent hydrolase